MKQQLEHDTETVARRPSPRLEAVEHYAVPLENGSLHIRNASQSGELRGQVVREILPRLMPLLDGSRCREQIHAELDGVISPSVADKILNFLEHKGLVREVEEAPPALAGEDLALYESMARYFGRFGSRYATLAALRTAHIGIVGAGPVVPVLTSSLAHFGVPKVSLIGPDEVSDLETQQSRFYEAADRGRTRAGIVGSRVVSRGRGLDLASIPAAPHEVTDWESLIEGMSMVVVLLQGPVIFHPWLEKLNAAALAANIPWTSVALLDGDTVHIGPTVRPHVTACYKCFEMRYKSNLLFLSMSDALDAYVQRSGRHIDFGLMPPVAEIVAGMTAMEVVRTLGPDTTPQTSGRLMAFHTADFSTEYHPVLKLPRCPACSPAVNQPAQRIWS